MITLEEKELLEKHVRCICNAFTNESIIEFYDVREFPIPMDEEHLCLLRFSTVMEYAKEFGITPKNLTTVKFDNKLKKIENCAILGDTICNKEENSMFAFNLDFSECSGVTFCLNAFNNLYLENLIIPNNSWLKKMCFNNCEIENLTIGEHSVVENYAFSTCTGVCKIHKVVIDDNCVFHERAFSYGSSNDIHDLFIGKDEQFVDDHMNKIRLDLSSFIDIDTKYLYEFNSKGPGMKNPCTKQKYYRFSISDYFSECGVEEIRDNNAMLLSALQIDLNDTFKSKKVVNLNESIAICLKKEKESFTNVDYKKFNVIFAPVKLIKNLYFSNQVQSIYINIQDNINIPQQIFAQGCEEVILNNNASCKIFKKFLLIVNENTKIKGEDDFVGLDIIRIENPKKDSFYGAITEVTFEALKK